MPANTYNPSLVDLDFARIIESTPDGECMGGCLPQTYEELMAAMPPGMQDDGLYRASPMTDAEIRSAIKARKFGLRRLVTRVFRQKVSDCVGNASVMGGELVGQLEHGHPWKMSPGSIYDQIGRSSRSGAYLGDAMKVLTGGGFLPQDTPENVAHFGSTFCRPVSGFRGSSSYRDGTWEQVGNLFRLKIMVIRGWRNIATAIERDNALVFVGRASHCILYMDVQEASNGRGFIFPYLNSWGSWGDEVIPGKPMRGIGYDSQGTADRLAGYVILGMVSPTGLAVAA